MTGSGASMQRVPRDPNNPLTLGLQPEPGYATIPIEHTTSANGLPTYQPFGYSNGGEFRKTYKGVAPPFAQVISASREWRSQLSEVLVLVIAWLARWHLPEWCQRGRELAGSKHKE